MTIAYCVNIWNHYQGAFCRAMAELLGDDFKMVLFTPIGDKGDFDGSKGGSGAVKQPWVVDAPNEPWIVQAPSCRNDLETGPWNKILEDSDVAIIGYCGEMSLESIRKREREGKSTYFIGERLFKEPIRVLDVMNPRKLKRLLWLHNLLKGKNTSYLEISHYGCEDLKFLHVCEGRIYQWGYFPATSDICPVKLRSEKLRLGWCGRLIDWKHVEYIVRAAALLEPSVLDCCDFTIVGEGPEKRALIDLAKELSVDRYIKFETYKPVNETMEFMRSLDVYMFPSDRGEGWGVALMEAMDKGCVPIANESAGASKELIVDGENGFLFRDGDIKEIANTITRLVTHRELLDVLSRNAWALMQSWSPQRAAKILVDLCKGNELPHTGLGRKRG